MTATSGMAIPGRAAASQEYQAHLKYLRERPGYVDYESFVQNWHPDHMAHFQRRADACTFEQAREEWQAVMDELRRRLAEAGLSSSD